MSRRSDFFKAVHRKQPERIPYYFCMCRSLEEKFVKKYGITDYRDYFEIPIREVFLKPTGRDIRGVYGRYTGGLSDEYSVNEWGVGIKKGSVGHFFTMKGPLEKADNIGEVKELPFPDFLDDYRWEGVKESIDDYKSRDYVTMSGIYGDADVGVTGKHTRVPAFIDIFESSWYLRGLLFFPSIINPVAIVILWSFIYNKQWGLLNNLLSAVGLGALQTTWTAPDKLFWAILVALVWMYTGFYCVILLAALDRIPADHLEAAEIEGASEFTKFFKIKVPLIWDVLVTSLILWGITAIKEFSLLYACGGGIDLPPDGAQNLAVFMYVTAFGKRVSIFRMGYSTSMGIVMFLMVVVLVAVISLVTRRESVEY